MEKIYIIYIKYLNQNYIGSDLMIIRLPREFFYSEKKDLSYAYVQDECLYIKGSVNYEDLMYQLTYELKGYNKCYFCGSTLNVKNRTIDHVYPRRWGGISISENMKPSCKSCNQDKKDMTNRQFELWRRLKTKSEQDAFYHECVQKNINIAKQGKFILRKPWVTMYDTTELIHKISFKNLEASKSQKLARYFINWKQYPHPIIVSGNGWVFKGKHILEHSKRNHIKMVPAIVLENVIVIK